MSQGCIILPYHGMIITVTPHVHQGISNNRNLQYLLNSWPWLTTSKISTLHIICPFWGNPLGTNVYPTERASNKEGGFIWKWYFWQQLCGSQRNVQQNISSHFTDFPHINIHGASLSLCLPGKQNWQHLNKHNIIFGLNINKICWKNSPNLMQQTIF